MTVQERLSASLEDYLETIYNLIEKNRVARSRDIAQNLDVSGASVTGALRALSARNLVNYAPYELITLTDRGRKLAEGVVRRHKALKAFFVTVLGMDEKEAGENACRIEHAASEDLMERLSKFAEFIQVCPRAGARWLEGFGYFCEHPDCGHSREECERCLAATQDTLELTYVSETEGSEVDGAS
jgi:DtxR family Mn-dependent transcriptional regulator